MWTETQWTIFHNVDLDNFNICAMNDDCLFVLVLDPFKLKKVHKFLHYVINLTE